MTCQAWPYPCPLTGCSMNDGNGGQSGHVRVYDWDGLEWNLLTQDLDGAAPGDRFGESMSLSSNGKFMAVKAPSNYGNSYVRIGWLVLQHQLQLHSVEWECRY